MHAYEVSQFSYGSHQIAYRTFGSGSEVWLAFHGFGQIGEVYASVEKRLGHSVTLYAIDLFFHGESRYGSHDPLSIPNWNEIIQAFLVEQRIERFSLMGFSLGGRFALATIEACANRLDKLVLIAPDGIERNVWYEVATRYAPGRSAFQYVLKHLQLLNGFGHVLTRFGLLNRTIMRFVETSLDTPAKRDLVYTSWTQFRYVRASLKNVATCLNTKSIRVYFFVGAYDRIVSRNAIVPLTKKLKQYDVTIFKTGHNRLIEMTIEQLAEEHKQTSF